MEILLKEEKCPGAARDLALLTKVILKRYSKQATIGDSYSQWFEETPSSSPWQSGSEAVAVPSDAIIPSHLLAIEET